MLCFFLAAVFCTTDLPSVESTSKELASEDSPAAKLRRVNAVNDLRKLLEETEEIEKPVAPENGSEKDVVEIANAATETSVEDATQNAENVTQGKESDGTVTENKAPEEVITAQEAEEVPNPQEHDHDVAEKRQETPNENDTVIAKEDGNANVKEEGVTPEENPTPMEENKHVPRQEQSAPKDEKQAEQEEPAPMEEDKHVPKHEKPVPEGNKQAEQEEPAPMEENKRVPRQEQSAVKDEKQAPKEEKPAPKDNKQAPEQEKSIPKEEEKKPIFDEETPTLVDTLNTPRKKIAKFKIDSVIPSTISSIGGEELTIETNETVTGPIFCKFNDKIVAGRHGEGRKLMCIAPELPEGDAMLSVSIDKNKWCREITLTVLSDDSDMPWIVVAIGGAAVLGIAFMAVKMLCWKRKVPKRKAPKKRPFNQDPFEVRQKVDKRENLRNRRKLDSVI